MSDIYHSSNGSVTDSIESWVKNTRLFKHCEERKKQIEQHKWFESEKAGHDIGLDRAKVGWIVQSISKDRSV